MQNALIKFYILKVKSHKMIITAIKFYIVVLFFSPIFTFFLIKKKCEEKKLTSHKCCSFVQQENKWGNIPAVVSCECKKKYTYIWT